MQKLFENWREFRKETLNEVSDYEIFRKQKRNPYTGEKMSYPAEKFMQEMAPAKQIEMVRMLISFVDPTQISSWPDIPPAYNAWEKSPSVWNTSLLLLALLAVIPVAGKFAKIAKPGLKVALKRAKIDATIALKNSKADVSDALKHISGQTKKVNLSDQSRLLQSINWARREMDPDHELYDNLVALRKRERYGELRRSTDFKTLGWRDPDVMLKGLRLIKIKTPKVVYHGGAKGINKDNLKVASRSGHRNIMPGTQAGFYTTADTESAKFFKSSRAGEEGQLYKIQIDPKANVYQLPDKFVRKDAGLAHMSVTDQKELFNQGVQGLWDPKSKDLVIFDKSIVLDMSPI